VDDKADVYSMGAVALFMATGASACASGRNVKARERNANGRGVGPEEGAYPCRWHVCVGATTFLIHSRSCTQVCCDAFEAPGKARVSVEVARVL
jgi:hypothetical protein